MQNIMTYKVLIVDDEKDLRDLFSIVLARAGFQIDVAENGQVAFDKIKASHVDLVLSDVRMPIWDGFRLIKEVDGLQRPTPKFIFMSGYAGQDESQLKVSPNFADFISKPIDAIQLVKKIKGLVAN